MKTAGFLLKSVTSLCIVIFVLALGKLLLLDWFPGACKAIGAGVPVFMAVVYIIALFIVVVVLFGWIFPYPDCHDHKESGDFDKIVIRYKENTDENGKKFIEGEVKLVPENNLSGDWSDGGQSERSGAQRPRRG